jgi:hypothetical protein
VAKKKKLKEKVKREQHIADELFVQVGMLAGQLSRVDEILTNAELPGPTIEAWAMQVRDLLSSLVSERGIVSGGIVQAFTLQRVAAPSGLGIRDPDNPDGDTYTLLTDRDLQPFSQETRDILEGRHAT